MTDPDELTLTPEQLCAINQEIAGEYGGVPRDPWTLRIILSLLDDTERGRPLYPHPGTRGIKLMLDLATAHPFPSGNLRTALVAGQIYLRLHGLQLRMNSEMALAKLEWMATGQPPLVTAMAHMRPFLCTLEGASVLDLPQIRSVDPRL